MWWSQLHVSAWRQSLVKCLHWRWKALTPTFTWICFNLSSTLCSMWWRRLCGEVCTPRASLYLEHTANPNAWTGWVSEAGEGESHTRRHSSLLQFILKFGSAIFDCLCCMVCEANIWRSTSLIKNIDRRPLQHECGVQAERREPSTAGLDCLEVHPRPCIVPSLSCEP